MDELEVEVEVEVSLDESLPALDESLPALDEAEVSLESLLLDSVASLVLSGFDFEPPPAP